MWKYYQIGLISTLSLACLACQPKAPESQPATQEQPISEPVVIQAPRLEGQAEKLTLILPECGGNNCPELDVQRLVSNQAWIDQVIDAEILKLLPQILSIAPKEQSIGVEEEQPSSEPIVPKVQLETQVQPFADAFLRLDQELRELNANHQINVMIRPRVLNSEGPLVTVVLNSSHYLGGAHGASSQRYYNFDLESKKQLHLKDIVADRQFPALEKRVYEAFKLWVIDSELADNVADYEQAWKFSMTDNFYLSPQGLILQYAEYEIGPYVVGLPRFVIPYEDLTTILKPTYLPVTTLNNAPSQPEKHP